MNEINKFIEDIVYIMKNGSFYEAIGITLLSIASILICCLFFIKVKSVEEWLLNCPAKNLVKALGLKEQKIVEQESPND